MPYFRMYILAIIPLYFLTSYPKTSWISYPLQYPLISYPLQYLWTLYFLQYLCTSFPNTSGRHTRRPQNILQQHLWPTCLTLAIRPDVIANSGKTDMMTRVSSQPCMKAFTKHATKVTKKNTNIPIFSPMPSCSLFKSLEGYYTNVEYFEIKMYSQLKQIFKII